MIDKITFGHLLDDKSQWAGAEKVFVDLIEVFTKNKIKVNVLVSENNFIDKINANKIKLIPKNNTIGKLFLVLVLFKLFIKEKNMVFISHHRVLSLIANIINNLLSNQHIIIHIAHVDTDKKVPLFKKFVKNVIAVSQSVKYNLINIHHIMEQNIVVIKNKTQVVNFSKNKLKALKNEIGYEDDKKIILNIGRLSEQKGHKYLINAVYNLVYQKKIHNFQLLIVGKGEYYNDLKKQINHLKLGNYIILMGQRSDIAELYNIANFFALSSLWEGLPIVILESICYEKPIISTKVSGVVEVLTDNNSLLVESKNSTMLSDSIERYLTDKNLIILHKNELSKLKQKNCNYQIWFKEYIEAINSFKSKD